MERFAVVDVETTGGSPIKDRMVEIGMVLLEGGKVVDQFQTLLNPERVIPLSVQAVHGISNDMVADAPVFSDVAETIASFTREAIFVAHNASFDYGFVKAAFQELGWSFDRKKVCSVRYARKALPGLKSYSLANLTRFFAVENERAHRALADARATAEVFFQLLDRDPDRRFLKELLSGKNKVNQVPSQLDPSILDNLPETIGIYTFRDALGKVLYVGKANNLKERVLQHFSGHTHTRQKRSFLSSIQSLEVETTGHELMALLLENERVKKHYPPFNTLLKDFRLNYGLFRYTDGEGYHRLVLGRSGKWSHPVRVFPSRDQAFSVLLHLSMENGLCLRRNDLAQDPTLGCSYKGSHGQVCGICSGTLSREAYNQQVDECLEKYLNPPPQLVSVSGREPGERGLIWIEKGKIKATGFSAKEPGKVPLSDILPDLKTYYDTQDAQSILLSFLRTHPAPRVSQAEEFELLEFGSGTESGHGEGIDGRMFRG